MNHTAVISEFLDPQMKELISSLLNALDQSQPTLAYQRCLSLCSHLGAYTSAADSTTEVSRSCRLALAPSQERKAKELMIKQIASTVRINDIAKHCSLSRSHFSRAFKQNTGLSPQDWLLHARVQRAKELLSDTTLTIAEIGLECGFADQSHFTRSFGRLSGTTPCVWRRQQPRLKAEKSVHQAHYLLG